MLSWPQPRPDVAWRAATGAQHLGASGQIQRGRLRNVPSVWPHFFGDMGVSRLFLVEKGLTFANSVRRRILFTETMAACRIVHQPRYQTQSAKRRSAAGPLHIFRPPHEFVGPKVPLTCRYILHSKDHWAGSLETWSLLSNVVPTLLSLPQGSSRSSLHPATGLGFTEIWRKVRGI